MNNIRFLGRGATQGKNEANQDNFLYLAEPAGVFGVFDGVGGSRNGEGASNLTASTFEQESKNLVIIADRSAEYTKLWLIDSMERANSWIKKMFEGSTTASVLTFFMDNNELKAAIINVGDSRVYGFNKEKELLQPLTNDDNWLPERRLDFVESKSDITKSMEAPFFMRNRITRAVGDGYGTLEVSFESASQFDGFLLTTDGIHDNLSHREITNILMNPELRPETIAQALIAAAVARSGDYEHIRKKRDDMTAIYVTVKPE